MLAAFIRELQHDRFCPAPPGAPSPSAAGPLSPCDRLHPLRGAALVTDGQMLYEETSRAEGIFFKRQKYDLAQTVTGAYHQNPAYTHWYGNAELKMDLIDLRAEASRLRQLSGQTANSLDAGAAVEVTLRTRQRRHAAGELDAAGYRQQKERLLRGYLQRTEP